MKSIKNFSSSDEFKNLVQVQGGYRSTMDKNGKQIDEELLTKNGEGDCGDPVGNPNCDCIDETYSCTNF